MGSSNGIDRKPRPFLHKHLDRAEELQIKLEEPAA
jgi:hypothetical protein